MSDDDIYKPVEVLRHPDPRLRQICEPVEDKEFGTENLEEVVAKLCTTMYATRGIGLSAPQIGINRRIFVRHLLRTDGHVGVKEYINPEISALGDEMWSFKEGCLSLPGVYETIRRPRNISVKAYDKKGNEFTEELSELAAIVVQHENDHLNGIEFIDHLSKFRKKKLIEKLKRKKKKLNREFGSSYNEKVIEELQQSGN